MVFGYRFSVEKNAKNTGCEMQGARCKLKMKYKERYEIVQSTSLPVYQSRINTRLFGRSSGLPVEENTKKGAR